MIRVKADTILTPQIVADWIEEFKTEQERRKEMHDYYINATGLKLPFAKKLVFTSASATLGDGVSVSEPENLSEKQKKLFDYIIELFENQDIATHDKELILECGATGTGYELVYMSDDDKPVPEVAIISSRNAFVVFDESVKPKSLYAVWFDYFKINNVEWERVNVADNINTYTFEIEKGKETNIKLPDPTAHNIGRVPLSKIWNNKEEQADFEQVTDLIEDRTTLHDLTLADTKKIVKNILTLINSKLAGRTPEEKKTSVGNINDISVLELLSDHPDMPVSAQMLSKNENYGMIDVFGKDLDSKIYDLTLIPDLTSDTFAGNITGVALELKLLPFKELVQLKEKDLIKLYKRRIKLYALALTQDIVIQEGEEQKIIPSEFEWFDTDKCIIEVHRNWTQNLIEISQMITTLQSTGLFSDKYLTNLMPNADFEEQKEQLKVEKEDKLKEPDPNNFSLADFNGIMREQVNATG